MLALSINILETLGNFAVTVIEQLGYVGVFVGMTLESTGFCRCRARSSWASPGTWSGKGNLPFSASPYRVPLGCLAGSLIAYGIGAYGGRPLLERYGKYVLIRKSELDRGEEWFAKHGESAVFISRLLPVVRSAISYPAGIVRMDIKRFSLYTVLGSLPFCFAFAYTGVALGPHWEDIRGLLRVFQHRGHRWGGGAYRVPHLPQGVGHGTFWRKGQPISDSRKGHTSEPFWG